MNDEGGSGAIDCGEGDQRRVSSVLLIDVVDSTLSKGVQCRVVKAREAEYQVSSGRRVVQWVSYHVR